MDRAWIHLDGWRMSESGLLFEILQAQRCRFQVSSLPIWISKSLAGSPITLARQPVPGRGRPPRSVGALLAQGSHHRSGAAMREAEQPDLVGLDAPLLGLLTDLAS